MTKEQTKKGKRAALRNVEGEREKEREKIKRETERGGKRKRVRNGQQ